MLIKQDCRVVIIVNERFLNESRLWLMLKYLKKWWFNVNNEKLIRKKKTVGT